MASVLLTATGAAAGASIPGVGWIAGPLLGTLGASIGTRLDTALGIMPSATARGPRLEQLRVQDSREGAPQPIIYGMLRTAGNVIWSSNLIETRHSSSVGGKAGGTRATTYSYAVHLAVGVAAGPVTAIHRIWADSKLIYDGGIDTSYADAARIYKGDSTQTPDALIQSYLGSGNVPAYRGTAYVVLENLQLAAFGNRIPNLTFEVEGASTGFAPQIRQQLSVPNVSGSGGILHRAIWRGSELLLPGVVADGAQWRFVVEHYSWQNTGFTLTSHVTSPAYAASQHGTVSAALSPDGNTLFMQDINGGTAGQMVLYDVAAQVFGALAPFASAGIVGLSPPDVAWLDSQTIITRASDNVTIGPLAITRAGLTITTPIDGGYMGLWPVSGRRWLDDVWLQPATQNGATMLLMTTDTARTKISAARLQRQNGRVVSAMVPDYVVGPIDGTSNNSELRLLSLGGGNFLRLSRTATGKVAVETLAFASGLFTQTRAATAITVGGTSSFTDAAVSTADTIVLTDIFGAGYNMAELKLTDVGFTLSHAYTPVAGSYTTTGYTPSMTRLSPYDFAYFMNGVLYWLQRGGSGNSVAAILVDLSIRAGLANADLALTAGTAATIAGFAVTEPMPARAAAEQILAATPFALAESDFTLRLTDLRTASASILPNAELRASGSNGTSGSDVTLSPVTIARARRRNVPRALALSYIDAANDYQTGSVRAALDADPQSAADTTSLPMVLTQGDAQATAERLLASAQVEIRTLSVSVSRAWLALDVGDLLVARGQSWRVTRLQQQGGLIALTATGFSSAALTASALAPAGTLGSTTAASAATTASIEILDLPPLRDSDGGPGIYVAATAGTGWPGGIVYDAAGTQRAALNAAATAGIAASILASSNVFYMDRARSVTVCIPSGDTLTSCTEAALYAGANLALLGSEIIQFQTATLIAPQTWQLSNLLRGRFGTEGATGTHAIGERFIMLDAATLARITLTLTDRNRADTLALVTLGQSPGDVLAAPVTYGLTSLQPWSPARLTATKAIGGDITISWQRRARINNGWADAIDVPLDVAGESYAVDIYNGGNVIRTISATTNSATYTAVMQTADFGSSPVSLSVAIAQISDQYGRGQSAATIFTFGF